MTSPYHALADMGLQVSMDGQGGLILGGLKSLPPKKRECALALAKKCKAEIVEALGRGKGPTPLPMNWAPDTWEGRPCCYLPHVPERLRGYLQPDLRGMGIPAEGLPAALRGFSRSGWRLVLEKGGKTPQRRGELERIASMWGAYLGQPISSQNAACMMALLALAREVPDFPAHREIGSLAEAAGYLGLAGDLAAREVAADELENCGWVNIRDWGV